MPQETAMNETKPALPQETLLKDPASAEIFADQLMDDIFEDVERVLDGGAKLPKDPVEPEFISLKSIKVPQIILPPVARPEGLPEDSAIDADVKLRDASAEKDQSFDRILLGTALASLLVTVLLWVATRGGFNRLFAPAPVAVPANKPLTAKTQADIKFADYIERALVTIEQDTVDTIPLLPPFQGTPPVENLPSVPVPDTNATAPLGAETNNLISAINRVADSIQDASNRTARLSNQVMQTLQQQAQQQAQQPVRTPTPGGQTSGTVSNPAPQTAQAPQPEPQPEATQQAEAQPQPQPEPAPATASVSVPTPASAPEPAPTSEPTPEPAPAPAAQEQPSETAANDTSAASIHTLVGILELGDRSAALFEVNGVARRVYVGESIAASGWTLVEVVNQEAVIRRNGEVLTIYVGQQF